MDIVLQKIMDTKIIIRAKKNILLCDLVERKYLTEFKVGLTIC